MNMKAEVENREISWTVMILSLVIGGAPFFILGFLFGRLIYEFGVWIF